MTGTEFGLLCGALGSAVTGLAAVIRERYKGANEEKKLALEADMQEHQQAAEDESHWREAFRELSAANRDLQAELTRLSRRDGAHEEALRNLARRCDECDQDRQQLRERICLLEQELVRLRSDP